MATQTFFQSFKQTIGRAGVNLNTDTLKVALSDVAPNAATGAVIADITQIANGNGYTTGGTTIASTSYAQTGGVGKLSGNDVTFTASGGAIAQFRYVVIYDSTANVLISFVDIGSEINVASGNSFIVDFDATNGILTLT